MTKQLDRLKKKIEEVTETNGVSLDEQSHEDFRQLVTSSDSNYVIQHTALTYDASTSTSESLVDASACFVHSFCSQPLPAAAKKWIGTNLGKAIKKLRTLWYVYYIIMCRSSGAYEALRDSGCIRLPSQRTLRDYTLYIKASTGFSSEVDDNESS